MKKDWSVQVSLFPYNLLSYTCYTVQTDAQQTGLCEHYRNMIAHVSIYCIFTSFNCHIGTV